MKSDEVKGGVKDRYTKHMLVVTVSQCDTLRCCQLDALNGPNAAPQWYDPANKPI